MPIVYFSFILLLFYLIGESSANDKTLAKNKAVAYLTPILLLCVVSFILGVRDIRSDFVDYRIYYNNLLQGAHYLNSRTHEFLYHLIQQIFAYFEVRYFVFYSFNVLLMILPVVFAAKKLKNVKITAGLVMLFYFIQHLAFVGGCNRQMIVISIFFYLVSALFSGKARVEETVILFVISFFIHRSAIIAALFYMLIYFWRVNFSFYIQVIVLFVIWIISPSAQDVFKELVYFFASVTQHSAYIFDIEEIDEIDTSLMITGIGSVLINLRYFVLLYGLNQMLKENFKEDITRGMLTLFFIGLCYYYLTSHINSFGAVQRANYPLYSFALPVVWYLSYCIQNSKKIFNNPLHLLSISIAIGSILIAFFDHISRPFYPGLTPLNFISL